MISIALLMLVIMAMSIILGIVTIPVIVKMANQLNIYDQPDKRKIHSLPIPRLGGAAFLPIALIASVAAVVVAIRCDYPLSYFIDEGLTIHLFAYIAGAFILLLTGIYDDVYGLGYKFKFIVQIISAILLCISGLWFADLNNIFYVNAIPFWIGIPLTILMVVYITNAMNLIDGIDGLAAGLSSIAFLVLAVLCHLSGLHLWSLLCISFIGILVTFFCYNVYGKKNKIFMGDAGSLTIGYTLSFLILHFWQSNTLASLPINHIGIIALSTVIIPCMDVVRVFMSRIRDGRNPFLPDKNHIHHKLMRTGLSARMTMVIILVISASFIISNYLFAEYVSETLVIGFDILFYIIMHSIINVFIATKEKRDGTTWSRELKF